MNDKNIIKRLLVSTVIILSATASQAVESKEGSSTGESDMSLEQLMNTPIYSASKRPEKVSEAPASVYVVTADDIKRSGVTSIPEALRMVPGVNVAQVDANIWAISIRGFNRQFSNKLLVMIDGRTVYSPLFSGVFWDIQDYVLEDIDRIEVVKGPGGTLWGENAVNGVINIITKEARKTQNNYSSLTLGTNGDNTGTYRYGGKTKDLNYYRVYAKYTNDKQFDRVNSDTGNNDDWQKGQAGFRYDLRDNNYNPVTVQGDFYNGRKGASLIVPTGAPPFSRNILDHEDFKGANTMLKWNFQVSDVDMDLQTYIDYNYRDSYPILSQEILTYDIDLQGHKTIGRHDLVSGVEYRLINYDLNNTSLLSYAPNNDTLQTASYFLQDKMSLVEKKLFLILGSKFGYNPYSDFEFQPNARLLYQINDSNSVWISASRAVRTPSIGEETFNRYASSGFPLGAVALTGNSSFESETLHAYEVGYRGDITSTSYFDVSAFYNRYYDLRTAERITASPPIIAKSFNNGYAETYGIEPYLIYGVTPKWDLKLGYTLLKQNFHVPAGSTDTSLERDEDRSPQNQFTVGSYVRLAENVNWDTNAYYVSDLHYYTSGVAPVRTRIPAYTRVDSQIRWEARKDLELSLIGQNLTDDKHQEFDEVIFATASQIPRAVLARVSYKW